MLKTSALIMLISALLLSPAFLPAKDDVKAGKFVTVPKTIINQDVPPIPIEIKKQMDRYTQLKSAGFSAWDPRNKGMIVATRLGDANTTQLYWVDKPLGELKQLTDYKDSVRGATFSPSKDKKYFLFTKDVGGAENYQIFRYDLDKGKAEMISDGKSRHMAITFNHKGDKFAYVNNSRTGMLFDVYVMDPQKPEEAKMVYQAQRPAYYIPSGWMHDDQHLMVVEYLSANKCNSILVDIATGKSQNITPKSETPQFFALGAASKDGKYFFGYTDRGSQFKRLVRVEKANLNVEPLTKDIPWDIGGVTMNKDMTKMAFSVNEGGLSRIYLMDPETFKFKPLTVIPEGLAGGMEFDPEGKRLFLNMNNARLNNDAFELDLTTMKLIRWTKSDTAGLNLDSFAMPKMIHYPTFDKVNGKTRKIPAFYYKPAMKTGKPFPVIINIHGGPESQYRPSFRGAFNYFVNELGIAVIAPNVRGSNGYGKSYLMLDNAEKREDSVKDIGALLDWIAAQPELDKNRVAVFGGSYGGYMVLASMFHYPERIACGVDIVGISNFVTFLKNTSAYRRDLRRVEYGDERKIGEFLNKISPTTNAHKIKSPLFVIQGKNDPRVPASEASQMVETVRKNKVPVWYQVATNEGHGFAKKDNRDFMYFSIVKFFQEYLLK